MGGGVMPSVALRPEDLLVEYRDKSLVRRGSIPMDDLLLKMQPVYNGVGSWLVQLPSEHRAVPYLRTPGAGILVTNLKTGETLLSGPASKPSAKASSGDPKGTTTIAGLTDDRLIWDARAFPSPTIADPGAQTAANDVRSGIASTLMRAYISANIGPTSPVGRRGSSLRNFITLGADPLLGALTTRRPRYDNLGELLKGIALETGLGFRLVQVGSSLQFQVYQPTDRSSMIRLDVQNGTLQDQEVEFAPPEVTRMIVAGQGEGVERQIISRTSTRATQAEDDWGLIIEEWKDQRNTDVTSELQAAGDERLNEAGFTKTALKATPSNDQTMIFLTDFFMGDSVAVVIGGQQQPKAVITEAAIVVDYNGIKTAVAIGDIADFDSTSALRQTVEDTQSRVDTLERSIEIKTTWDEAYDDVQTLNKFFNLMKGPETYSADGLNLAPLISTAFKSYGYYNSSLSAEDYGQPYAFLSANGWVSMRGLIQHAGAITPPAGGYVLFTLPPAYRPKKVMSFPVLASDGGYSVQAVNVFPNGDVKLQVVSGAGAWISLADIFYNVNDYVPLTLTSPWTALVPTSEFAPPSIYKSPDGLVHLAGAVQGGTASTTAFAIPSGYESRIANTEFHMAQANSSGGWAYSNYATLSNAYRPRLSAAQYLAGAKWLAPGADALVAYLGATYSNSWKSYGGAFPAAQVAKMRDGVVVMQGLINGGALGTAAFQLPFDWRPKRNALFTTVSNDAIARLDVMQTGAVIPSSAPGSFAWFSLDGIAFQSEW